MVSDAISKSPDRPPLRLLLPDGTVAAVIKSEPQGADCKLELLEGNKKRRLKASALPPGTANAQSGEVIENPVQFLRHAWCKATCERYGGWRLDDLINALPIEGLGPSTAAKLSSALGNWERFLAAIEQLRNIDLPETRDDIVDEQMEQAYRAGQGKEISRTPMSTLPGTVVTVTDLGNVELDPLYPEPLQTLINSVGPQKWKLLRKWADSPTRQRDLAELLSFGKPLPNEVGDLKPVASGNALSRAQNLIPNFNRLSDVRPFYIEYEGGKQPRPRLVKLVSAHVDRGMIPVLHCFSYDDEAERHFRLDKILDVLDEQGNIQPLPAFWKRTLGVEWPPGLDADRSDLHA
jgi:hypothetical protein